MEAIPRNYDECRFDAFCKSVLRNEAHNYRRGLKRQRDRQVSISALSQADMDKLSRANLPIGLPEQIHKRKEKFSKNEHQRKGVHYA